jgi:hypothetical protein
MSDHSFQQLAATLAAGLIAAAGEKLYERNPEERAKIAVDTYHLCLKELKVPRDAKYQMIVF